MLNETCFNQPYKTPCKNCLMHVKGEDLCLLTIAWLCDHNITQETPFIQALETILKDKQTAKKWKQAVRYRLKNWKY